MAETNIDSISHDVAEQLYKQNQELAVRNKTLSLLRELYQISILTIDPKTLGGRISNLLLDTLELEFVSIYSYTPETGPALLGYSQSPKLKESWGSTIGGDPSDKQIDLQREAVKKLLSGETIIDSNLTNIWSGVNDEQLLRIKGFCHIRTTLIYPLMIDGAVRGLLNVSLNREYNDLSQFERESIINIINVIAVALDRSILYQQIKIANEKLKELDRQKTEFVSIASHQLRSPLTAIKGYSSMLLEGSFGPVGEKAREAIDRVFQSSQKLVLVIEDFLNISRIELGTMKYEWGNVDFEKMTSDIVGDVRHNLEQNGLQINFKAFPAPVGTYTITADSGKISQVVSNLIDNANKYTKQGGIDITLSKEGNAIRLTVKDTGVGIDPTTMPKLFAKFSRSNDAGKINIKGTGLGLYVAKQIVDAHHGKIWAESEGVGKGSTFIVELPVSQTK